MYGQHGKNLNRTGLLAPSSELEEEARNVAKARKRCLCAGAAIRSGRRLTVRWMTGVREGGLPTNFNAVSMHMLLAHVQAALFSLLSCPLINDKLQGYLSL